MEFNIDDLNTKVEEHGVTYWTNGRESTDLGYIAFNSKDHMITVNTSTGVLDDKNGFIVNNFSISGTGSSSSLITETPDTAIECGMHRGFNKYDYLNVLNKIMNQALHEIEGGKDGKAGIGDWLGYLDEFGWVDNTKKYTNLAKTLSAKQAGSSGALRTSDGYIHFTDYSNSDIKLTSEEILFEPTGWITTSDQGIAYIGNGSTPYTIDLQFIVETHIQGSTGLKFKDASIDLTKLNIASGLPGCDLHITVENGLNEDLDITAGSDQANNIYNMPY